MATRDPTSSPLTIRQIGEGWEVVVILEQSVEKYVRCDSKADAEAVADARPLDHLFVTFGQCEVDRVQRCIDALVRYGLESALIVRRLRAFVERLGGSPR